MSLVRFATVAFGNAEIVRRLANSIADHCTVPFEIVCWDNSPQPLAQLRELAAAEPRFRLAGGEGNLGFTKAVNRAASVADGPEPWTDWVLINPDAYLVSPFDRATLAKLRALDGLCGLRVYTDAGKTFRQESARSFPGFATAVSGREGLLTRLFPNNPWSRRYLRRDLGAAREALRVDWVSGCALYAPRALWRKLGGLDERYFLYADDVDLGRTARSLEIAVYYAPWVDVIHESRTAAGRNPWRSDFYHHAGMTKYYWKWASPLGRLCFPVIAFAIWARFVFRRLLGGRGRMAT